MALFAKLLVPTDFSACSNAALDLAIELARSLAAPVRLLHVYHAPTLVFDPYGIQPAEPFLLELPAAARERLGRDLDRLSAAGLEASAELREGAPVEQILAEVREQGVDLVIMGTHGHTGLEHVLLGSVAERTVREAPCAVLTVRLP